MLINLVLGIGVTIILLISIFYLTLETVLLTALNQTV